jgi:cytochrome c biogenesis factor
MVLPILSSFFVFLAVGSVAVWRYQQANAQLDERLRAIAEQQQASLALRDVPFEHRVVLPVVDGVANAVIAALPPAFIARTRKTLVQAGEPMSLVTFFGLMLFLVALLPGTYLVLAVAARAMTAKALIGVPAFALLGVLLPFLWLRRRARR